MISRRTKRNIAVVILSVLFIFLFTVIVTYVPTY